MASTGDFKFQLSNSALLDKIDKLRDLGVGDFVPLPQLVVVGDQSSGKSSILEAILELPFPRDSGLCTRFATHVSMRRKSRKSIVVSIAPAASSSPERQLKLRAFKVHGLETLTGHGFTKIFQDACTVMDISGSDEFCETGKSTFSNDALKIELTGPDHENLSIIDIPGIFRSPTEGVTTTEDMALVKEMVQSYIRDDRTIILAVLPANVDIATQEILSLAKAVDPNGIRTLGVLTKPDLVDAGGEENVMDLVRGKRKKLRLGYCVVRNRGQKELSSSSADRFQKEREFFSKAPWSSLDTDRVGVSALKGRLQELLVEITRREFPKVKMQIDQRLSKCKASLAALGPERGSPEQQRTYLQQMAINFQKLTDFAADSYYARDSVFRKIPALRLSTLVRDQTDVFSRKMTEYGHTVKFQGPDDDENGGAANESLNLSEHKDEPDVDPQDTEHPDYLQLTDLFQESPELDVTTSDILEWIDLEYRRSRGFGLETIGPAILPTLWQQQSRKWGGIAESCMKNVIFLVHDFITKLLEHVCPDERTRGGLRSVLMDNIIEQYKKAIDRVRSMAKVESCTMMTKNGYYNANLKKFRSVNLYADLESVSETCLIDNNTTGKFVNIENIEPMGNEKFILHEIHSILKAYYKIARERFIDNVCLEGINFYLIHSDDSPLRIFSPLFVASMPEHTLDEIAGEEQSTRRRRKELEAEIMALEEGKKLVRL